MSERTSVLEDHAEIRARRDEIYETERRCGISADRSLYDCLRMASPCAQACPYKHRWKGNGGVAY